MSGKQKEMNAQELIHYIEQTIQQVQGNPETNMHQLRDITALLKHNNIVIVQVVIIALTDLFIDIAPLYKIDKHAHQDKLKKFIKKEEKQVLQFEVDLIEQYYQLTQALFMLIRQLNQTKYKDMLQCCYQSIFKLLTSLFHFNYMDELTQYAVYALLNTDFNQQAYQFLIGILSNKMHSLHDLKIKILSYITQIVQTKPEHQQPDNLIEIINHIKIDTKYLPQQLEVEERQKKKQIKQAKRAFFSQKEKDKKKQKQTKEEIAHQKKLLKEVEEAKQEASADLDKKILAKQNGEILSKIFYIYFRILKQTKSKFYEISLNGILQFVHLINVQLIQDLIKVLINACQELRLQQKNKPFLKLIDLRLKTIYCLNQLIDGPGQAFDVDDKETTSLFYKCLLDIFNKKAKLNQEEEKMILQQFYHIFLKKRHFSQETVGSFIKIMTQIISSSENKNFVYASIFGIKQSLLKYQKAQKMIEEDNEGVGFNQFNIKIDDPSSTNALNSSIYLELQQIKQNWNKEQKIVTMVSKILKSEPLPQHLVSKSVIDVYN